MVYHGDCSGTRQLGSCPKYYLRYDNCYEGLLATTVTKAMIKDKLKRKKSWKPWIIIILTMPQLYSFIQGWIPKTTQQFSYILKIIVVVIIKLENSQFSSHILKQYLLPCSFIVIKIRSDNLSHHIKYF